MLRPRFASLLAVAFLALTPAFAHAQEFASRVPADAVVYVEWRGLANLPAYNDSNLKGVVEAAHIQQQIAEVLAIVKGLNDTQANGQEPAARLLKDSLEGMIAQPTAIYFGGIDWSGAQPQPKLALLCKAGPKAQDFADRLNKAFVSRPEQDKKAVPHARAAGDLLIVTIGKTDAFDTLNGPNAESTTKRLADDKDFTAAVAQVQKDPAILVYVSGATALTFLDKAVAHSPDPGAKQGWPVLSEVLGAESVHGAAWTGAFDGKEWSTRGFIGLSAERTGLVSLLNQKPLPADTLAMIPKDATWAGTIRFDGERTITEVRDAAGRADDRGQQQFDFTLKTASGFLGVDIKKDLFGSLGDTWVYYGTTDATGNSLRGATFVNKLRDEKTAAKSLASVEDFINGTIRQRRGADAKTLKTIQLGGYTIHTIALEKFAPSWTVANGCLIISLSPQGVLAAADWAKSDKKETLADNPDFAALRKALATQEFSSFSFTDLPKTAPEVYDWLTRMNAEALANAGEGKPPISLPPLEKIKPYLAPAAQFYWADTAGWHMVGRAPFPGSEILGGDRFAMQMPLVVGLQRARQQAMRTASAANLHQIGRGLYTYANDNQGAFPADLGTLVAKGMVSPQVLVAPGVTVPADILAADKTKQAEWVNQNTSYVYLVAGQKQFAFTTPAETPIAYEKLDLPSSKVSVNVLYADGHVEAHTRANAEKLLNK